MVHVPKQRTSTAVHLFTTGIMKQLMYDDGDNKDMYFLAPQIVWMCANKCDVMGTYYYHPYK